MSRDLERFWVWGRGYQEYVKGIGIGFFSCIGMGFAKTISQVLGTCEKTTHTGLFFSSKGVFYKYRSDHI